MSTGTIGAKIVLEGEAAYRKALRDINTAQKELRSEMKLCNSEFKDSQNSMEALNKKHQILAKQVETSAKKVETYEKALATSSQKEELASKKIEELEKALVSAKDEYERMAKTSETTADALEAQEKSIASLEKELQNANTDYDKAAEKTKYYQTQINNANAEMLDFEHQLKDTDRLLDEANNSMDGCAHSIDEYGKEIVDAGDKTISFGDILKANLSSEVIIAGMKALVNGIKDIATASIEAGMQFEAAMSNVQALSGANAVELGKLSDKAKELGASTMYSASQVADAMSYMALAGWDTEQTLSGIGAVLDLAAASSMDLARASDIVTDYLTAFGLKASDAQKFTDQLAYAMSNSNTTVDLLGESYKNCASAASSMGFSVEDVTSALMVMANAGVKGGEAGTSLRSIMINLATNTNECADALEEFGVQVYDTTTGDMNSLSEILVGTAKAFEGLSDQEANALAKTIAGKTQFAGFETILLGLNDAAKESGMSFEDYAEALKSCDGAASKMAKTMQDNLKGKVTALESALEGLKISTYEVFDDSLKKGVEAATSAVSRLNKEITNGKMSVSLDKMSKSLEVFMMEAVSTGERALPKLIDGMTWLLDNGSVIASSIVAITASIKAQEIVGAVSAAWRAYSASTEGATIAQWALNTAMNANPIGLLITALAGLTAGMIAYSRQLDAETKAARLEIEANQQLVQSFKDSAEDREEHNKSLRDSADTTKRLVDELLTLNGSYDGSSDSMMRQKQIIDQLNTVYPDLNLAIDENTGKLNLSAEALRKNVDAMMRLSLASAAEEDLKNIASELYEAEKLLTSESEKLSKIHEEQAYNEDRLTLSRYRLINATDSYAYKTDEILNTIQEYENELYSLEVSENAQAEAQRNAQEAVNALKAEYEQTVGIIEQYEDAFTETAQQMDEFASSAENAKSSVIELSEQASDAITGMYDTVGKSITGQMDLFSEWNEKQAIQYSTLITNLDAQTTALEKWSENLALLSKKGIDEGLYKKLAEMGPEGAAYVQAFVDMATTDNKAWTEYQDNFREAVAIQESTKQEITEDYAELAGYITDGMTLGIQEGEDGVLTAIATLAKNAQDEFQTVNDSHSPSKVYEELAGYITDGMAVGLEEGEEDVLEAMETLAENTIDTARDELQYSGEFYDIGYNVAAGLAEGIASGAGEVASAVMSLCDSAITTAQKKLQIHSPSRVFKWMGEMSGEGYIDGFQESMEGVGNTISTAMSNVGNVGAVASSNNNQVGALVELLNEYLPEIAENNANVSVSLDGGTKGLFNAVVKQNRIYRKANGASAFA